MKYIFSIFLALTFTLAAGSAVFADDTMGAPDTLQKNEGPGNIDATTHALNRKKAVPAPTPPPVTRPKAPEKAPASSGY